MTLHFLYLWSLLLNCHLARSCKLLIFYLLQILHALKLLYFSTRKKDKKLLPHLRRTKEDILKTLFLQNIIINLFHQIPLSLFLHCQLSINKTLLVNSPKGQSPKILSNFIISYIVLIILSKDKIIFKGFIFIYNTSNHCSSI